MKLSRASTTSIVALLLDLPLHTLAQSVIGDISLGHEGPVSRDRATIPNWTLTGDNYNPTIFSDRVALTPPYPGNQRAALWANNANSATDFSIDVEFRASGPERASGNLQLWYVKEKPSSVFASVYSIDSFDGLALVVDQYGSEGGSIRGFLNDGSLNFRGGQSVDSLAFGHCSYSYRNLGRYSRLKITQGLSGLVVSIDDRVCFQTSEVNLPTGYRFGISAASAENPDSFEITKFVVSAASPGSRNDPVHMQHAQAQQMPANPQGIKLPSKPGQNTPPSGGRSDDGASDPQVLNLLKEISREVGTLKQGTTGLQTQIDTKCGGLPVGQILGTIQGIERRMGEIEKTVKKVQQDVEGRDYKQNLNDLQQALRDTQSNLLRSLPQSMGDIVNTSAPRMGFFIFVIIAFQVTLVILYVVYKRRRANMPKKFL